MFTGEDSWCQLFSEPGAGSDLAGLACRAVRDGDEWVITGQKVWNTLAHLADRGMLVARTDPDAPKHKGLTYFALDMHAPGVEVRPLRQITGEAEFNEVYLTEVRVPDADRIGDVGEGWRVAMTTLVERAHHHRRRWRPARHAARAPSPRPCASGRTSRTIDHTATAQDRLVQMWIHAEALRLTNIRAAQNRKAGNPGPEGSIAKLMFAEVNKDIYELCVDLLGAQRPDRRDYEMRRSENLGLVGPPGSTPQDVPALAGQLHRGRHLGDPAQHPRRARARAPRRAPRPTRTCPGRTSPGADLRPCPRGPPVPDDDGGSDQRLSRRPHRRCVCAGGC